DRVNKNAIRSGELEKLIRSTIKQSETSARIAQREYILRPMDYFKPEDSVIVDIEGLEQSGLVTGYKNLIDRYRASMRHVSNGSRVEAKVTQSKGSTVDIVFLGDSDNHLFGMTLSGFSPYIERVSSARLAKNELTTRAAEKQQHNQAAGARLANSVEFSPD